MKPRSPKAAGKGRGRKPALIAKDIGLALETLWGLLDVYPLMNHTRPTLKRLLAELRRSLRDTRGRPAHDRQLFPDRK